MKLKAIKRESTEFETELDLPVYLYFQDEFGNDELVMITEKYQISVKYDYGSVLIEKSRTHPVEENYLKNNTTTKEHFMEIYNEALKSFIDTLY